MAPKKKGTTVNLLDLQREMGVGAALLPTAPKPVDEAALAAEKEREQREYDRKFGAGGGRWADRMTDSDDDEWRKESEGSGGPSGGMMGPGGLNGGGGMRQRNRMQDEPELPDEPWRRTAPLPSRGGDYGGGDGMERGGRRGGRYDGGGADPDDEDADLGVLRSASKAPVVGGPGRELSRGGGAEGRRGGGQDEDFDFGELRKGPTREQQPVSQASSSFSRGAKHPGDEEDLDFAAVRSKSRPTFSSQTADGSVDARPEHLRNLRSRLKKVERPAAAGEGGVGAADGVSSSPSSGVAGGPEGEKMNDGSSSSSRPTGAGGDESTEGGSMEKKPSRYIPPSKRGQQGGLSSSSSTSFSNRGLSSTSASTQSPPVSNSRASALLNDEEGSSSASSRPGGMVSTPVKDAPISSSNRLAGEGTSEGGRDFSSVNNAVPQEANLSAKREEGQGGSDNNSSGATCVNATGSIPASSSTPTAASPAGEEKKNQVEGEQAQQPPRQKFVPRCMQRLEEEKKKREESLMASTSSPSRSLSNAFEETTPAAGGGGGGVSPPSSTMRPSGSRHTDEPVQILQPVRLGSTRKEGLSGSFVNGKYVPAAVRLAQQGSSSSSALGAGSKAPASVVERIFKAAAGGSASAASLAEEEEEEKRKEELRKKKEEREQRERERIEALRREREELNKIFYHKEETIQNLVAYLEKQLQSDTKSISPEETLAVIPSEDELASIVPSATLAGVVLKACGRKETMAEVLEVVHRVEKAWKALLEKCTVNNKEQVLIKQTVKMTKEVKCPRLSSDTALIEAVWDAMIETGILPEASFIQWFEDDSDETEGRTEVLFQVLLWCQWLKGEIGAYEEDREEPEEEEPEEDYDIEALVPKRETAKVVKRKK
ncbi:eif4-gamma eif5 eif2b-epsilon carboxy-terminal domain protein [Cystoisospora suis]|uniref:Eif4-gamma eif5 eif2b-epsilon carboxy-terminal domain protein n=1 Tax=Cystoisospora suis TaxID=483139 RepID=A0A2C6KXK9_9APIC|nr:eif4-gamma eif5 eif2b-epsilon carboxy-terminal domain protein [Cystoisospora suis]